MEELRRPWGPDLAGQRRGAAVDRHGSCRGTWRGDGAASDGAARDFGTTLEARCCIRREELGRSGWCGKRRWRQQKLRHDDGEDCRRWCSSGVGVQVAEGWPGWPGSARLQRWARSSRGGRGEALGRGVLDHGRKEASDRELLSRSNLEEEAPARWGECSGAGRRSSGSRWWVEEK